ncbi:MAG TPA: Ig domain-containing protein, partial [Opitutaceae bacterium]|nr:Ig domain-containing protein [Opitutaceae bacterium]
MRFVPLIRALATLLVLLGCAAPAPLRAQASLPVISSPDTAPGTTGQPFSYAVTATNSPTSYFAQLPRGLTINQATGVISGVPQYLYRGPFYVFATNATGTVGKLVNFALNVPSVPWIADLHDNESPFVGTPYFGTILAYDNGGYISNGLTFAAEGLPPGLTLDS